MNRQGLLKLLVVMLFVGLPINILTAQIVTDSQGRVIIMGEGFSKYGNPLTVGGGMDLYQNSGAKFLRFDITPANPRVFGTGNQVVFYNTNTGTYNDIQVRNVLTYSDARAKTNIQPLNSSLSKLLQLSPVSYNFKDEPVNFRQDISPASASPQEMGFLAQEVEEIFPNAVYTDEEGKKLINYISLIPVLVDGIKILKAELDEKTEEIEALKNGILNNNVNVNSPKETLYSCSTEPNSSRIALHYYIENGHGKGLVQIANMQGNQLKTINVDINNNGYTYFNHDGLSSGIYFVSLIYQNKLIGTQKLIISK